MWLKEEVPEGDTLYMRVHETFLRNSPENIPPGVFKNRPTESDGMSVNWERYCLTAHDAQNKANEPLKNAVIKAVAGEIRTVPGQTVEHTPIQLTAPRPDRSHCDVLGVKTTEARAKLSSVFRWAIKLS